MNNSELDSLKASLGELSADNQDYIAGFLLVERLKRNSLVLPSLHQRIEDANPDNWQLWQDTDQSAHEND